MIGEWLNAIPSWTWLLLIVFGGAVVVISNIYFTGAKGRESRTALANAAKQVLLPELQANGNYAAFALAGAQDAIPIGELEVTAWETISKGGLISGLDPEELRRFLDAYGLVYQANSLHAQIMELTIGLRRSYSDATTNRNNFISQWRGVLVKFQSALSAIGVNFNLPANDSKPTSTPSQAPADLPSRPPGAATPLSGNQ